MIWNFHDSVSKDAISIINLIKRELNIEGFLHLNIYSSNTGNWFCFFLNLLHFCGFAHFWERPPLNNTLVSVYLHASMILWVMLAFLPARDTGVK